MKGQWGLTIGLDRLVYTDPARWRRRATPSQAEVLLEARRVASSGYVSPISAAASGQKMSKGRWKLSVGLEMDIDEHTDISSIISVSTLYGVMVLACQPRISPTLELVETPFIGGDASNHLSISCHGLLGLRLTTKNEVFSNEQLFITCSIIERRVNQCFHFLMWYVYSNAYVCRRLFQLIYKNSNIQRYTDQELPDVQVWTWKTEEPKAESNSTSRWITKKAKRMPEKHFTHC